MKIRADERALKNAQMGLDCLDGCQQQQRNGVGINPMEKIVG
jgi:hypothetical protein